jgi:biopolymer transport protein ExbD
MNWQSLSKSQNNLPYRKALMEMPDYDIEIVVKVQPDHSVQLNDQQATVEELAQRVDEIAEGRRVRLEIFVWPPQDDRCTFLAFVKAVQAALRKAESPVVTGYHTVSSHSDLETG